MTDSAFRGPLSNMGSMEDSPATVQTEDGPAYTYQAVVVSNLRASPFDKDGIGPGRVPAFLTNPQIVVVDNIPSTATTTILATAAAVTSGTGVTLTTAAPGNTVAGTPSIATGVPLIPFGSTAPVTAAIVLDFGFTTGTTTAASSAVVVVDSTLFTNGQWITIGGAANSGKTAALITQVTGISNATTITVSPAPSGSLTNAPIGGANLFNNLLPPATQFGPGTSVPNAWSKSLAGGLFRIFNPLEAISRGVSITATTTAALGGAFLVSGWDVFDQAMTQLITVAASTTTSYYSKKAFKAIASVIPQFTDATGTYSVGISDLIGFPIRIDRADYVDWTYNGVVKSSNTGIVTAVTTPANNTAGDVRGTLQLSATGPGTAIVTAAVSNGTSRLFVSITQPLWNTITGTPLNTAPFFGVNQV
jgi:hypothetical protein